MTIVYNPFTDNLDYKGASGGSGDVVGPGSAVNNDIAVFDGTTGKLIKDGGKTIAQIAPLTTKGDIYGFSTVPARLPVGTDGQVLEADSASALGVKWVTTSGGGNVNGPGSSTDRAISTWNGVAGTALFDNPSTSIDSSGFYTNSAQPAFYYYHANNLANQTGDGTSVTFPFDTLVFERGGSNFNTTTHQYTIPKSGLWTFTFNCYVYNVDVTNTVIIAFIRVNATDFRLFELNAANLHTSGEIILNGSYSIVLTAGFTVECLVAVGGAGKNVGLAGGFNYNAFTGRLEF